MHSRRRSVTISSVIPFRAIRLLTVVAALLFAGAASASIPRSTRDLSPIVAANWLYDTAGNRVGENNGISGSITNRFCNGLNQFWSLPYDADGNMLSDGVFAYTWDAENRLVGVASNGISVASYLYDSQNRRISKTANGVTHQFVYDGWNLMADVSSAGNTYYIWGPDRDGSLATDSGGVRGLLAIISSGGTTSVSSVYYPVMNNHGDVTALFDSTGTNIVAKYERDPFGVLLSATGPAANVCPFGFQTKYTDPETGLIYFGHRLYSPTLGRFMPRDPKQEEGGFNLYGYGNGNPLKIDGLGLDSLSMSEPGGGYLQYSGNDYFLPWSVTDYRAPNPLPPPYVQLQITAGRPHSMLVPQAVLTGSGQSQTYLRSGSNGKLYGSLCEARQDYCWDAIESPPKGGSLDEWKHYFYRNGQPERGGDIQQMQANLLFVGIAAQVLMPVEGGLVAKPIEGAVVAGVERRIAAEGGSALAKEQMEFAFVKEVERQTIAHDFYQTAGFSSEKMLSHLRGIDFTKPVTIVDLPAGKEFIQYRLPNAPLGLYCAEPGTPAFGLGIYTSGLETRQVVLSDLTHALRSTTADIKVDWELQSWRIIAPGGEVQYFIPNKTVLLPR